MRTWILTLALGLSTPALAGGANKAKVLFPDTGALGPGSITYYTGEGGVVISPTVPKEGYADICVVPPAAGVRQVSSASDIKIKGGKGDLAVELGGSTERDHEVTKLFEQQQGVLFLQFAMYRLCEAARNGDLDPGKEIEIKDGDKTRKTTAYVGLFETILGTAGEIARAEVEMAKAKTAEAVAKTAEAEAKRDTAQADAVKAKADAAAAEAELLKRISTPIIPR